MDENLKYYLRLTPVSPSVVQTALTHPGIDKKYPPRDLYPILQKYAHNFFSRGLEPRLISLAGLRGTGKTTLLWQMAAYLHRKLPQRVFFFNVNILHTLGFSLFDALEAFQQFILKKRFNALQKPIALLFDEVQDDPQWSKTLKILYDEAPYAFILCSGSSALLLNQTADLARRMQLEKVFPFKFTEFIRTKNLLAAGTEKLHIPPQTASQLKEALFFSEHAQDAFQAIQEAQENVASYWQQIQESAISTNRKKTKEKLIWEYINYKNIPAFLPYYDEYNILKSLSGLTKRIVFEDLPKINPSCKHYFKAERLLFRLAGSEEINIVKLAGDLELKKKEVEEFISLLQQAELIIQLPSHGGLNSRISKNKKAFFMSPSLRRALLSQLFGKTLPQIYQSKLLEDLIVMYLRRLLDNSTLFFSATKKGPSPDFVIETHQKPLALKVSMGRKTARQVQNDKTPYRYGIVVNASTNTPLLKNDTLFLPLHWFILM